MAIAEKNRSVPGHGKHFRLLRGTTVEYSRAPDAALNADWSTPPAGTNPIVNNLYQGMTLDPVTGLYYERNRNYSPSLGTWTSQDPAGYINGANTYQFVMSNPVGSVDASGELCLQHYTIRSKNFNGIFWGRLLLNNFAPLVGINYTGDVAYAHGSTKRKCHKPEPRNAFIAGNNSSTDVFLALGNVQAAARVYGKVAGGPVVSSNVVAFARSNQPMIFKPPFGAKQTWATDWVPTNTVCFLHASVDISLTIFFGKVMLFPAWPGSLSASIAIP